jgi:hypothetical protein
LIAVRSAGVDVSALAVVAGHAEGRGSMGRGAGACGAAGAGAGLREEMGRFGAERTSGARLSIRQGDEDGALLGERSVVAGEGVWVVSVGCRSGL